MMNEELLKAKLKKMEEDEYELENQQDYYILALEMMKSIGSLDSELRDDLIFGTLYQWIIKDKFDGSQLKDLLNISLDDKHMFFKLYEQEEDAVYTRTFSALVVALVLYKHREQEFLSEKALYEVKDRLIAYMNNEKDLRGFVERYGWAHSAAHTSDAIDELARCSCFKKEDMLDILNSIKAKACIGYYVYIDEESERMINAVEGIFERKLLSNEELIAWIKEFSVDSKISDGIIKLHLKVNVKGFLRSLYFRLLDKTEWEAVVKGIREQLKNLE